MDKHILNQLFALIQKRKLADPQQSYTAKLVGLGKTSCARKVGEEALEVVIAALAENDEQVINESADLLYHWLVLMAALDINPDKVYQMLAQRMKG